MLDLCRCGVGFKSNPTFCGQLTRRLEHLTVWLKHELRNHSATMLSGVQWISVKHSSRIVQTISCASALIVVSLYAWLISCNSYLKFQPVCLALTNPPAGTPDCMFETSTTQPFSHHADWQPVNLRKTLPWTQLDNFLYVSTGRHKIVSPTNVAPNWYQSFTIALRHVNPRCSTGVRQVPNRIPISYAYLIIT